MALLSDQLAQQILSEDLPGFTVVTSRSGLKDAGTPFAAPEASSPDVSTFRAKAAEDLAGSSSGRDSTKSGDDMDLAFFTGRPPVTSEPVTEQTDRQSADLADKIQARIVKIRPENASDDLRDSLGRTDAVVIDPKLPPGKRVIGYKG